MSDVANVIGALHFAAHKHRSQPRKDEAKTPYINHVIAVVHTLATVGDVSEPVPLMAAALHDTIEDTETSWQELEERFGSEVCRTVREVTDDKSLPKQERKRLQIEHASHLSDGAKELKLADKTCDMLDVIENPAVGWSLDRRIDYLDWTEKSAAGCRGVNEALEAHYDRVLQRGREVSGESESMTNSVVASSPTSATA
jgi:guanosine-3',5'-bis(diphosphate) 3'-pyrophosphohydrolase